MIRKMKESDVRNLMEFERIDEKKESLNGKEIKRAVVLITVVPLHVILELAGKIHNNTLNACECE